MVKYLFQTAWSLATTVIYRKPTRTDRLLDQPSYNPATSQKATTIWTLTRRAQLVCDSPDSLQDETDYLNNVFSKNNYNTDFVRRNTHSNTDSNTQTNVNSGPVTTATIPYIRGTSETIARILQPYNIRVAHKPITTLRRLLTNVKDKDKPEDRQGAVYKIKCCDCQATYIGETGRNLSTRLTERKRATRNGDVNNHIADHHLQTKHQIDWDSATCITYSTDYYQRLTLESWFTNLEQTRLNRVVNSYRHRINDLLETLRSRSGQFTANEKLRFAVNGSRYPCAYIWDLTFAGSCLRLPCLFSFIHLVLYCQLTNCLQSQVFLKQISIINKQKSS